MIGKVLMKSPTAVSIPGTGIARPEKIVPITVCLPPPEGAKGSVTGELQGGMDVVSPRSAQAVRSAA